MKTALATLLLLLSAAAVAQGGANDTFGMRDIATGSLALLISIVGWTLRQMLGQLTKRIETLEISHSSLRDRVLTEHYNREEIREIVETAVLKAFAQHAADLRKRGE